MLSSISMFVLWIQTIDSAKILVSFSVASTSLVFSTEDLLFDPVPAIRLTGPLASTSTSSEMGVKSNYVTTTLPSSYHWFSTSITKTVSQMSQKGSWDIFHIFECPIVRSKSAHQTMPWSYHSLDFIEVGWYIIPASSVRLNNMGMNTRLSENCLASPKLFLKCHKKGHEAYFTSSNVRLWGAGPPIKPCLSYITALIVMYLVGILFLLHLFPQTIWVGIPGFPKTV